MKTSRRGFLGAAVCTVGALCFDPFGAGARLLSPKRHTIFAKGFEQVMVSYAHGFESGEVVYRSAYSKFKDVLRDEINKGKIIIPNYLTIPSGARGKIFKNGIRNIVCYDINAETDVGRFDAIVAKVV